MTPIRPDFTNQETLDQEIVNTLVNFDASYNPVRLQDADLSRPFVYDRRYGVFYVGTAKHAFVMATIYAWDRGYTDYFDMPIVGTVTDIADDYLIKTVGTAFRSSLSTKRIVAGKPTNLNDTEIDYFGNIYYIG